eukprot:g17274.t1
MFKCDRLLEWRWAEVIEGPETGKDLATVEMWLHMAQHRIKGARRLGSENVDPNLIAEVFAGLLFEPFFSANIDFPIFPDLMLSGTYHVSQVNEIAVRYGQIHHNWRKTHSPAHPNTVYRATEVVKIFLEHGTKQGMVKLAKNFKIALKKLAHFETDLGPVDMPQEHLVVVQGRPKAEFREKIKPLCRVKRAPQAEKEARFNLAWGNFVYLLVQKLKRYTTTELQNSPVGISTDGVVIGGVEIAQVRVRGKIFGPVVTTVPLPPLVIKRVTTREISIQIMKDNFINHHEGRRLQMKTTFAQASLRCRIEEVLLGGKMGVDYPVVVCVDQGGSQRKFWIWMMASGYKVVVIFDPPHRDSRDLVLAAQAVLPRFFERILKFRTVAGKTQSCKMGDLIDVLDKMDDFLVMELAGFDRRPLERCLAVSFDHEHFLDEFRAATGRMRSQICKFSGAKRFAKFSFAASFMIKNWPKLTVLVRMILRREHPYMLRPKARTTILKDPNRNDRMQITFETSDINRLRRARRVRERLRDEECFVRDVGAEDDDEDDIFIEKMSKDGKKPVEVVPEQVITDVVPEPLAPEPGVAAKRRREGDGEASRQVPVDEGAGLQAALDRFESAKEGKGEEADDGVTKQVVQDNFWCIFWVLLSDAHARVRILTFEAAGRACLYYHSISIAACWTYLNAHGVFWSQQPAMLADTAKIFNGELSGDFDEVLDEVDHHLISAQYGEAFEEVIGRSISTHLSRMGRWTRILMYGMDPKLSLTLEDLKKAAPRVTSSLQAALDPILKNPENYVECTEGVAVGLQPPRFYNYDLTSKHPDLEDKTKTLRLPRFTDFGTASLMDPVDFELKLAERIERVKKAKSDMARAVVPLLMRSEQYWHVTEFISLLRGGKTEEAKTHVRDLQAANPITTRDIEQRGGQLSKTSQHANHSGSLCGNVPWSQIERLVPMYVPALQPFDEEEGQEATTGIKDSYSVLDNRQLLGEDPAVDFQEAHRSCFPEDSFEDATPGLVDIDEFRHWIENHTGANDHDNFEQKLQEARQYFTGVNQPQKKKIRDMVQRILHVDKDVHDLTDDEVRAIISFKFDIAALQYVAMTEMLIFEQWPAFELRDGFAKDRWDRARLQALYLGGIYQRYKEAKKPLILLVQGPLQEVPLFLKVNTAVLPLRMILSVVGDVVQSMVSMDGTTNGDAVNVQQDEDDLDEDDPPEDQPGGEAASSSSTDVFMADAMMETTAERRTRFSREVFRKNAGSRVPVVPNVRIAYPETAASYALPLPTSEAAKDTKLRGVVLNSPALPRCQVVSGGSIYTVSVLTTCRLMLQEDRKIKIEASTTSGVRSPLAAAVMLGMLNAEDEWIDGHKSSVKGMLRETVEFLIQDEPKRLRSLIEPSFCFHEEEKKEFGYGEFDWEGEFRGDGDDIFDGEAFPREIGYSPRSKKKPKTLLPTIEEEARMQPPAPTSSGSSSSSSSSSSNQAAAAGGGSKPLSPGLLNPFTNKPIPSALSPPLLQLMAQPREEEQLAGAENLRAEDLHKPADPDFEECCQMAQYVRSTELQTSREYAELVAALMMGQEDAVEFLVRSGVYQKVEGPKGTKHRGKYVITMQLTCENMILQLAEAASINKDFAKNRVNVRPAEPQDAANQNAADKAPTAKQLNANAQQLQKQLDNDQRDQDPGAWAGPWWLAPGRNRDNDDDRLVEDGEDLPKSNLNKASNAEIKVAGKKLEEKLMKTATGRKQYEQSKNAFHCDELNLFEMHEREKDKCRKLCCFMCGVRMGHCRSVWIDNGGPKLDFWKKGTRGALNKRQRGLGPQCHTMLEGYASRCVCGKTQKAAAKSKAASDSSKKVEVVNLE